MNVSPLLSVPFIVLYRSSRAQIIFSIWLDLSGLAVSSGLLLGTLSSRPLTVAVATALALVSPAAAAGREPSIHLLRRPRLRLSAEDLVFSCSRSLGWRAAAREGGASGSEPGE